MIDSIILSPNIHMMTGGLTLLASFLTLVVTSWAAWKKKQFTVLAQASLIFFQLVLMVQVLVGIKLLDQGLGPLQLYIHYLGGLAPIGFCLIFYWLPIKDDVKRSRFAAGVATLSVVFVVMTFTIGSMYVPGGI